MRASGDGLTGRDPPGIVHLKPCQVLELSRREASGSSGLTGRRPISRRSISSRMGPASSAMRELRALGGSSPRLGCCCWPACRVLLQPHLPVLPAPLEPLLVVELIITLKVWLGAVRGESARAGRALPALHGVVAPPSCLSDAAASGSWITCRGLPPASSWSNAAAATAPFRPAAILRLEQGNPLTSAHLRQGFIRGE